MNYFAQRHPFLTQKIALHITCTEKTKIEILQSISHFYNLGIKQFVIIRGDGNILQNGFQYASELVRAVRNSFLDVAIYIAGYPEKDDELQFCHKKIELGINACITQICFDANALFNFKQKLKVPVLPGLILPTQKSLDFAKQLGINVPKIENPEAFLEKQIKDLISFGFKHLHFYTLNNLDNLLFLFYDKSL